MDKNVDSSTKMQHCFAKKQKISFPHIQNLIFSFLFQ